MTDPRYGVQISYKLDGIVSTTRTFNNINIAQSDVGTVSVDDFNDQMIYEYFSRLANEVIGVPLDSCKLITYRTLEGGV